MVGLHIVEPGNIANLAIMNKDIAHTAGKLAADGKQRRGAAKIAVAHNHIFRRLADTPGIAVAPGLHHKTIVTGADVAIFDYDIARHFDVDAIVVESVGAHFEAAHNHIFALQEMDSPKWAVLHRDPLESDIDRAVQLNELRAHHRAGRLGHDALLHRVVFRSPPVEDAARLLDVGRRFAEMPRPLFHARLKRAFASDGDIRTAISVDERRIVHAFKPLPARHNRRQAILKIVREAYDRPLLKVQFDVTLEVNGSGMPGAFRHHHPSTTCRSAIGYRLCERRRAFLFARLRPVVGYPEVAIRENELRHRPHFKRHLPWFNHPIFAHSRSCGHKHRQAKYSFHFPEFFCC